VAFGRSQCTLAYKFQMKNYYRNIILPRVVFIPFLIARIIIELLNLFTYNKFIEKNIKPTKLCLESGIKGWNLIEYKELFSSAIEYLGEENILKISISKELSYYEQVSFAVKKYKPTHYLYDSRTGDQHWFYGLIQAFRLSILFQLYGVVPICTLTDLPVRRWRTQTAVVSAKRGVVVSLMSPKNIFTIFPHSRIIGPLTMPFSIKTVKYLDTLITDTCNNIRDKSIIFTGSLYEPRTTILNTIQEGLRTRGIELELKGRSLGTKKFSDEDYWVGLVNATMVITTANQISSAQTDWAWISHLIYRYLEVPIAGSVLVAQEVPSLRRYFVPGVHYIAYKNTEDAIKKIEYYWHNPQELSQIASQGREKAKSLVFSNLYWICVDIGLRNNSLL